MFYNVWLISVEIINWLAYRLHNRQEKKTMTSSGEQLNCNLISKPDSRNRDLLDPF